VPYSWPSKKRAILRNIGKISKSLQVKHTHSLPGGREGGRGREWVSEREGKTCRSFCGFQSESKIITVSAVARLIPSPPARVDKRKQKSSLPGALKCSMA